MLNDLNVQDNAQENYTILENRNVFLDKKFPNGVTFASKAGEGLGCPPESWIAGQYAYQNGYDAIRINVCKTKDGFYVCSHNESINLIARNADGSEIDQEIKITEHTLDELNCYDYGIAYGEQFKGLKITTIEQMISVTSKLGLKLDIEWKYPNSTKDDFEHIYDTIVNNGYSNKNWHWIAYSVDMVEVFKEVCDFVDIEVLVNQDKIDWELIEIAQSENHEVIVGYWMDNMKEEDVIKLRKKNIVQNRGTASSVNEMISHLESGVTELECRFQNPKKALIEYGLQIDYRNVE